MALLTLEDLTARVGLSVRTVRFYTSKGLVPPPERRGRQGYYTADHVARLELIRELQAHGFTLAAIEGYLESVPANATPAQLALRRTMLAPWQAESTVDLSRDEIDERLGRRVTDAELDSLEALGIAFPTGPGRFRVSLSQLNVGLSLLDLGFPVDAARAAARVYAEHGRAIADELHEVFRTMVWPHYVEGDKTPEQLRAIVEALKPLSVAGLVAAYEAAVDDYRREDISSTAARAAGGRRR